MYVEHPVCRKPQNEHIKIWHYMDFFKFVSLLYKQALFFPRAKLLDDPFEGAFPQHGFDPEIKRRFESSNHKDVVAVNCWHMNEHESAAMWKLYGDAIAVQSTFERLAASFAYAPEDIYIGSVEYIDYKFDTTRPDHSDNMLTYLLHKRPDFRYESELRALTLLAPSTEAARSPEQPRRDPCAPDESSAEHALQTAANTDLGVFVGVDLATMIERIYVSPTLKPWVTEVVESIVRKYCLDKPVQRSTLFDPPDSLAFDAQPQRLGR